MDSGRYINPYTDFGFKYLFGTEPNKDITLELVNALLQGHETIKSLTLLPTEQLGDTKLDRRSVFDVYCENEKGEKIIIEMQKADQQWFKDRSVYYSSFPIRSQGEKGRAEGLAEGEDKANRMNARRMKADGMDAGLIAKYTHLSLEEIEKYSVALHRSGG